MKKLIILILLFPLLCSGQKIKKQLSDQIGELKELTGKYCTVSFGKPFVNTIQVYANEDVFEFIDELSGKKIKFETITTLLNFMDKNGWDYVNTYGDSLNFFIFKRKEHN